MKGKYLERKNWWERKEIDSWEKSKSGSVDLERKRKLKHACKKKKLKHACLKMMIQGSGSLLCRRRHCRCRRCRRRRRRRCSHLFTVIWMRVKWKGMQIMKNESYFRLLSSLPNWTPLHRMGLRSWAVQLLFGKMGKWCTKWACSHWELNIDLQ